MNFLIYTWSRGSSMRTENKFYPNTFFFKLVFYIAHLQFFAIKYNKMERKTSVHKTHLNKCSKSQNSPVLLEIWGMKDTLENTSCFHPREQFEYRRRWRNSKHTSAAHRWVDVSTFLSCCIPAVVPMCFRGQIWENFPPITSRKQVTGYFNDMFSPYCDLYCLSKGRNSPVENWGL